MEETFSLEASTAKPAMGGALHAQEDPSVRHQGKTRATPVHAVLTKGMRDAVQAGRVGPVHGGLSVSN